MVSSRPLFSPFVGATSRLCHHRPEPSSWSTLARETSVRRVGRPLLLVSLSSGPGTGRPGSTPFGSTLLGQVPREALGPGPGWREGSHRGARELNCFRAAGPETRQAQIRGRVTCKWGARNRGRKGGQKKKVCRLRGDTPNTQSWRVNPIRGQGHQKELEESLQLTVRCQRGGDTAMVREGRLREQRAGGRGQQDTD